MAQPEGQKEASNVSVKDFSPEMEMLDLETLDKAGLTQKVSEYDNKELTLLLQYLKKRDVVNSNDIEDAILSEQLSRGNEFAIEEHGYDDALLLNAQEEQKLSVAIDSAIETYLVCKLFIDKSYAMDVMATDDLLQHCERVSKLEQQLDTLYSQVDGRQYSQAFEAKVTRLNEMRKDIKRFLDGLTDRKRDRKVDISLQSDHTDIDIEVPWRVTPFSNESDFSMPDFLARGKDGQVYLIARDKKTRDEYTIQVPKDPKGIIYVSKHVFDQVGDPNQIRTVDYLYGSALSEKQKENVLKGLDWQKVEKPSSDLIDPDFTRADLPAHFKWFLEQTGS